MKTLAIAAGALLFGAAATANADHYVYRSYPPATVLSENQECWNPHAGHFEGVRPGDYQPDLDFSRCRMKGEAYAYYPDNRYYADRDSYYYGDRTYRRQECWNPHAGHFERVRPGEYQGDLDFSRCRVY
ncbi:MAG: hypothetical protein ACM3SO_07745 [Betaproteobacteria bacterium]